jgi:hypothetical protein
VASQPLSKLLAQESGASKRRCQDYSPPPVSARVLTLTADSPPTFHHSSPKPPHCVQTTRKPGQVSSGHTLECAACVSSKTKQKKTRLPIDKRYTAAQARESCRTIPIFGAWADCGAAPLLQPLICNRGTDGSHGSSLPVLDPASRLQPTASSPPSDLKQQPEEMVIKCSFF